MGYNTQIEIIQGDTPAELTIEEHDLLQHCERIITEGINTFYEVANALATVNRRKLYRETHSTFEAYCREKWDMGKAQAYRMIDTHEVRENLSPIGDEYPLPEKESHVRALKKAPADKQPEVWQNVVDSGEPITAKTIEKAVQEATIDLEERKSRIGKYYEWPDKAFKVLEYDKEKDQYLVENVVTKQQSCMTVEDLGTTTCEESYIQSVYLGNTTCSSQCETCQSPCHKTEQQTPVIHTYSQTQGKVTSSQYVIGEWKIKVPDDLEIRFNDDDVIVYKSHSDYGDRFLMESTIAEQEDLNQRWEDNPYHYPVTDYMIEDAIVSIIEKKTPEEAILWLYTIQNGMAGAELHCSLIINALIDGHEGIVTDMDMIKAQVKNVIESLEKQHHVTLHHVKLDGPKRTCMKCQKSIQSGYVYHYTKTDSFLCVVCQHQIQQEAEKLNKVHEKVGIEDQSEKSKSDEYYEQLEIAAVELNEFVKMFDSIPKRFEEDFMIEMETWSGVFEFYTHLKKVSQGLLRYHEKTKQG